jgi:hypothetical protein
MTTPFTIRDWHAAPVFTGRVATEEDVNTGTAVYALSDTLNGRAIDGEFPQPVIWYDEDDEYGALIVQAEAHDTEEGDTLEVLGLLLPNGETVVAFADDVDEVDATDPFWVALVEAFDEDDDGDDA